TGIERAELPGERIQSFGGGHAQLQLGGGFHHVCGLCLSLRNERSDDPQSQGIQAVEIKLCFAIGSSSWRDVGDAGWFCLSCVPNVVDGSGGRVAEKSYLKTSLRAVEQNAARKGMHRAHPH